MAVEFKFEISPGVMRISLPGMDFCENVAAEFSGENVEADVEWFMRLTVPLHRAYQQRNSFKYLALKLFNQFDYVIESDMDIDPAYLEQLAYALQLHLRVRRLAFNGRELGLSPGRRSFENWVRLIFVEAIPVLLMFLSPIFMPPFFRSNPLSFLFFLLAVVYLLRFIGKGLWMFVLREVAPWAYVETLMLAKKKRLSAFDRFWVRLLWQKTIG